MALKSSSIRPRAIRFVQAVLALILLAFLALPTSSVQAALTDLPTSWSNFTWHPYLFNGNPVYDHETSADPSNGGAAVQPKDIDIASGAGALGPGTQPSVLFAYYDGGTPGDANYADDFYGFRMRLNADPQFKTGYSSRHWEVLIDIDGDNWKEFVIDLTGDFSQNDSDRLYVFYNNNATNTVDPVPDQVAEFLAVSSTYSPQTYNHTRVVIPATGGSDTGEVWLDMQIPITSLKNGSGVQQVLPSSPVRLFYSTSASNTNPLQKDWMLTPFSFGDPLNPHVEATKADSLFNDADGSGGYSPGDTILYTIVITNGGNLDAAGVTFSDTPDGNTTLVVGSVTTTQGSVTSGNNPGNTTVGVSVGTLARGGGSVTITFKVTINSPFPPGVTQVANQGTVAGTNFTSEPTDDPDTPTDDDPTITPLQATADLAITKSDSPDPVYAGGTLTYTLIVTNLGPSTATNVVVTETYPAGFSFTSANPAPSSGNNQWTFGSIVAGGSQTITITGTVTAASGSLSNLVSVSSSTYDLDPTNNTATAATTIIAPELSIEKTVDFDGDGVYSHSETYYAGSTAHWKIVVTNTGNSPLSNVTVTDTNGQSFGPVSLAIGASQTFTYDTTVNANTTNTATAQGEDELGGTVGSVSDSATATPIRAIPSVPDLSLWGGMACALLLSALMVWRIRRRLIPRKET